MYIGEAKKGDIGNEESKIEDFARTAGKRRNVEGWKEGKATEETYRE